MVINRKQIGIDPQSQTLQRFPLVARPRPACSPLSERLAGLERQAQEATQEADSTKAAAVYNQAALLASDVGLTAYAAELCQEHAQLWLAKAPLPGADAIHALEPLVNLVRLAIRAGKPVHGQRQLENLYQALRLHAATAIAGIHVPGNLVTNADGHGEAVAWLWRVLLAEGTRAFTLQGQWDHALKHLAKHLGIGAHPLDGRQVSIIAALIDGDSRTSQSLLNSTITGADWEQNVTACLHAMHEHLFGRRTASVEALASLVQDLHTRRLDPALIVFDVRLSLSALDLVHEYPELKDTAEQLHTSLATRTLASANGYAARDILQARVSNGFADIPREPLEYLVRSCGLDQKCLSEENLSHLDGVVQTARLVLTALRTQSEPGFVPNHTF